MAKMGRPTEGPKTSGYRLRMTETEMKRLEECCTLLGMTKAEIIRLGIEKVYNEAQEIN